jgi:hypothetical protein
MLIVCTEKFNSREKSVQSGAAATNWLFGIFDTVQQGILADFISILFELEF